MPRSNSESYNVFFVLLYRQDDCCCVGFWTSSVQGSIILDQFASHMASLPETSSEIEGVRGGSELQMRLRSLLHQLRSESVILDQIVHKGKNQHGRASYFKYLLKVRRDVRLLLSGGPGEIFGSLFPIIDGKTPEKRFHTLERLKKKQSGAYNDHERLLGIARLLSQMLEPIIATATRISSLLARSFFMGYSLMILALLARLRVLVQQMLLDVVSLFNLVSDLSQEKHSIKLKQDGVEVFREYYPPCKKLIYPECVWEGDKFVLHERNQKSHSDQDAALVQAIPLEMSTISYETIEVSNEGKMSCSLQENICSSTEKAANQSDLQHISTDFDDQHSGGTNIDPNEEKLFNSDDSLPVKSGCAERVPENVESFICSKQCSSISSNNKKRVAFIQVGKVESSETNASRAGKKPKFDQLVKEKTSEADSFFKLLTTGCLP